MKFLKKLFLSLLAIIILVVVGAWLYTKTLHPNYNGELKLNNLSSKVTTYFDDNGVPHIQAENQEDAYTALGYLHAQDRLWQMELIRRIAAGRLSEILGKDLLKTDKFFLGLGIAEKADEAIAKLDKNSEAYQLTQAYLNGINQFIDEGATPIEFSIVGVTKEHYTIKDVYNVFGYMAFSFAAAHKVDPIVNDIKEQFGNIYVEELGIPTYGKTLIKNDKQTIKTNEFAQAVTKITKHIPIGLFIGSNSWIVGPEKSASGKVIFANDPHISFSQPSVWYQAHIKTPDYEMYGYHLALTPFPLLGHNRNYAYGLTMFENDDVDFYFETNNPKNADEYLTSEGYKTYTKRNYTINVKDSTAVNLTVKDSKHGPIMTGLIENVKDERPMAISWIYTKEDNKLLDACYNMSHAKDLNSFKNGVKQIHAPGLNVMYGDAADNIAWFAAGKLYRYRDSINTKTILDGASGKDEIVHFLDFEDNPQAINPNWNYVYSANNQPDSIKGYYYPGYYLPEDRAHRIVGLLGAKEKHSAKDMQAMLIDVTSNVAVNIVKHLSSNITTDKLSPSGKKALNQLKKWNGSFTKEAIAPTIYNRFIYEFMAGTFKDEMQANFKVFLGTTLQNKMVAHQAFKTNSVYWDDITTKDIKEDKNTIITQAFVNTINFLNTQLGENVDDWHWKRVLSVTHPHAFDKVATLKPYFSVGPFETNGGDEVINNHSFALDSTGYYKVKSGPSSRRVIDFADVENAMTIIPTGQSGNIFSPYYKNQADKYLNGQYVKMILNQQEIEQSKNKLILLPK